MTILQLGEMVQIMYNHCMDPEKSKGLIDIRFDHRVTGTGQDESRRKAWVDVDIGKEGEEKEA